MKQLPFASMAFQVAALTLIGCGGSGSTGGTPTTPGPTTGNIGATVTISATGVSESTPRIALGDRVRFVNNDTRVHQILSTPHGPHTDCPALNAIGVLTVGQSGTSDPLTTARGCGFHDHMNPDDARFRGQVLVGLSPNDPTPPDPDY